VSVTESTVTGHSAARTRAAALRGGVRFAGGVLARAGAFARTRVVPRFTPGRRLAGLLRFAMFASRERVVHRRI
jgi:hypothetical protein